MCKVDLKIVVVILVSVENLECRKLTLHSPVVYGHHATAGLCKPQCDLAATAEFVNEAAIMTQVRACYDIYFDKSIILLIQCMSVLARR